MSLFAVILIYVIRNCVSDIYCVFLWPISHSIPLTHLFHNINIYSDEKISTCSFSCHSDGSSPTSDSSVTLKFPPVAELAYVDRGVSATDHIYHVSAVYDRGESVPVKADYKGGSSVDVIGADSFSVSVAPGAIVIEGVENLPVSVILPDGKTIWTTTASSSVVRVGTAPGLYLVRVGRTVRKVIVP